METSADDASRAGALAVALARFEETVGDAELVAELIARVEAEAARAAPALATARDERSP